MIDAPASVEPGAYVAVCGASLIMGLVSIPLLTIAWINQGRTRASQGWPTVTGQVLEARVVEDTGGENGPAYKPRVRYAYDVGGGSSPTIGRPLAARSATATRLARGGWWRATRLAQRCPSITILPTRRMRCWSGARA